MEDFKNRLLEFLDGYLSLSVSAFEKECLITNGTIGSIKVKGPSVENLLKIHNRYPELNIDWLITGRGAMLIKDSNQNAAPVVIGQHVNVQNVAITNLSELKSVIVSAIEEANKM